jgi:hypothetical protein
MGTECTDYPVDVTAAYNYAEGRFGFIQSGINWLHSNRPPAIPLAWSSQLKTLHNNIYIVLEMLVYGNTGGLTPHRIPYIVNNCMGGTFDMDALLNEMLAASFDQLTKFVGITDAYRSAVWDAPFNADFYASLARGFRQWT